MALQDFRGQGGPADIGTYTLSSSAVVFPYTFSGVTYFVAIRVGVSGWNPLSAPNTVPETVINNAFTVLGAGAKVTLLNGTYNTVATINIPATCVLEGSGWGTVINYTGTPALPTLAVCVQFTGDRGHLRDCKIVIAAGSGVVGNRPVGIYANLVNSVEIHHVWCVGDLTVAYDPTSTQASIYLVDVEDATVYHCTVEDNHLAGINLLPTGPLFAFKVLSNTLRNNGNVAAAPFTGGIISGFYYDGMIADNFITGGFNGISASLGGWNISINTIIATTGAGIDADSFGVICGNTVDTTDEGIVSTALTISGNAVRNTVTNGIRVGGDSVIVGNEISGSGTNGILSTSGNGPMVGNYVSSSTVDGIVIDADVRIIIGNYVSNSGGYGIRINVGSTGCAALQNRFAGNVLGPVIDLGIDTILDNIQFTFITGGNVTNLPILANFVGALASAKGWRINAAAEWVIALGVLPPELQQVVRIKIWAVGLAAPGAANQMRADFALNGGGPAEPYTTEAIAVASKESDQTNFNVNDVITWTLTPVDDANIGHLAAKDRLECRVDYRAAVAPDIATNAVFTSMEIHYV